MENSLDMVFGKWHSEEVPKLIGMLAAAQIPYEVEDLHGGKHICIPNNDVWSAGTDERRISVVSNNGSYGGERGLLEIYAPGLNSGVEGYLNAKEAFDYIIDTRNGISRGSCG